MHLIIPSFLISSHFVYSASAAFAEPFWNSNKYAAGLFGAYPYQEYGSFDIVSPRLNILKWDDQCAHGLTLLTPRGGSVPDPGPMVLDAKGNLIWTEKKWGDSENLQIQSYKGEDFLTFWAGVDDGTHGRGYYYLLDSSYEIRHVVEPAGELHGDLHEFSITPEGTALMTVYETLPWDLSDMGVKQGKGYIIDSIFQEIDIETGNLIFEWRASDHFPVFETLAPIESFGQDEKNAFDYFHINSISKDPQGNYWISSRYMCAVFCISHDTGGVLYSLGGRNNAFTDLSNGAATNFTWQHHMTYHAASDDQQEPDYITIFDNAAYNWHETPATESRALKLQLDLSDPDKLTAKLLHSYTNPLPLLSHSQGSVQVLPPLSTFESSPSESTYNDTIFVGWGHSGAFTQYDAPTGHVLCDVHFGAYATFDYGWAKSYRAFKHLGPWTGRPNTRPDIGGWKRDSTEYEPAAAAALKVYASWNGATHVRSWRLQGAHDFPGGADDAGEYGWVDVAVLPKEGFEVEFDLRDYVPPDEAPDRRGARAKRHGDDEERTGPGFTYYRVLAQSLPAYDSSRLRAREDDVLGVSPTLNRHTGAILGAAADSHSAAHGADKGKAKELMRHKAMEARLTESDTLPLVLLFFACVCCGAGLGWWEWWKERKKKRKAARDGGGETESEGLLLRHKEPGYDDAPAEEEDIEEDGAAAAGARA